MNNETCQNTLLHDVNGQGCPRYAQYKIQNSETGEILRTCGESEALLRACGWERISNVVDDLANGRVSADNLAEWTAAARDIDWVAAYEATREDDEPTDASSALGDVMEAIYWYGVDCHSGQFSHAYQLQCAMRAVYTPGCSSTGPEPGSSAQDMYQTLCDAAGCGASQ